MTRKIDQFSPFTRFIGVDVGKEKLAVHDSRDETTVWVDNTARALAAFLRQLNADCHTLVVCEASGGYEGCLLHCLIEAGIAAHRAHAVVIKQYIASNGIHGKTDFGDARALACFGRERHARLPLWQGHDRDQRALQALALRRDDLVAMRTAEKNRVQAPQLAGPGATAGAKQIRQSCKRLIAVLDAQIEAVARAMAKLVANNRELKLKYETVTAICGFGPVCAMGLIAHMPELGHLNRRKAASLAGLAPHPKDSGKFKGYRNVRGGRHSLKRVLFMPAMVAAQGKGPFAKSCRSKIDAGKKPKVAIVATMRKILVVANAKVRDQINTQQS